MIKGELILMSKNIVLLGHGAGIKFTIESLLNNPKLGYSVKAVVTHPYPDHESDLAMIKKRAELYGKYAYNVFNVEEDYGIALKETPNVNDEEVVEMIRNYQPAYVISIGCRNILKRPFLTTFKNRVLNIHTTPLPRYRGAANDSWMILNGEWGSQQYGCIHFVDEGIDTGGIIAKSYYKIPEMCYPIDLFKIRVDTFNDLLIKGLENLEKPGFTPEVQDINLSTTFPRLFTPKNGKLNFNDFTSTELIRFIYAFGYPFEGAHCYLDDIKINILSARCFSDQSFHSLANGLIFGKNELGEYKVAVNGGYMLIKTIEINGEEIAQNKVFRLGRFLK